MKLPLLSSKELIKTLAKLGFQPARQKGSHMFFKHPDGRSTLIPIHAGDKIDRGLLTKIIKKDLEIGIKDFIIIYKK